MRALVHQHCQFSRPTLPAACQTSHLQAYRQIFHRSPPHCSLGAVRTVSYLPGLAGKIALNGEAEDDYEEIKGLLQKCPSLRRSLDSGQADVLTLYDPTELKGAPKEFACMLKTRCYVGGAADDASAAERPSIPCVLTPVYQGSDPMVSEFWEEQMLRTCELSGQQYFQSLLQRPGVGSGEGTSMGVHFFCHFNRRRFLNVPAEAYEVANHRLMCQLDAIHIGRRNVCNDPNVHAIPWPATLNGDSEVDASSSASGSLVAGLKEAFVGHTVIQDRLPHVCVAEGSTAFPGTATFYGYIQPESGVLEAGVLVSAEYSSRLLAWSPYCPPGNGRVLEQVLDHIMTSRGALRLEMLVDLRDPHAHTIIREKLGKARRVEAQRAVVTAVPYGLPESLQSRLLSHMLLTPPELAYTYYWGIRRV